MTKLADTPAALPGIDILSPGEAAAHLSASGEDVLSALMIRALRAHADSAAGDRIARTVSVSLDRTDAEFAGGDVRMMSKIDRQTRTLVFMGGALIAEDKAILKATAIFRLKNSV